MQAEGPTRQRIIDAALPLFAERGYAATSVQEIVDAAGVSKPALYYHFSDKAGLYRALVQLALDDRLRLMQEAAATSPTAVGRLIAVLTRLFEAARGSQDLLRIALAAAFAAPEEVPMDGQRLAMAQRNHDYFRSLVEEGQRQGELDSGRSAEELAFSLYGQLNIHLMVHLLRPGHPLTAKTARAVVDLFLSGAGANPAPGRPASGARRRRIAPETG